MGDEYEVQPEEPTTDDSERVIPMSQLREKYGDLSDEELKAKAAEEFQE